MVGQKEMHRHLVPIRSSVNFSVVRRLKMVVENGFVKTTSVPLSNDDFATTVFDFLGKHSNSTAMVEAWSSREITFDALKRDSESVARHLVKIGIRKGDVVGIFASNSIDWVVAFLGIIRIGGVVAAISSLLKREELKHQLLISGAKGLFTTSTLARITQEFSEVLKFQIIFNGELEDCISFDSVLRDGNSLEHLPSFDELNLLPTDPMVIYFSSGTTGLPKAVLHSHRYFEAQRQSCSLPETNLTSPRQVVLTPLSHIFGLHLVVTGILQRSVTFLLQKFDFNLFLELLQDFEIDTIVVVPPIAVLLAKSPEVDKYRLSLKLIRIGAAPLSKEIEHQLKMRFPEVICVQCYGLTECGSVCTYPVTEETSTMPTKSQSVGPPCVNVQMKVICENGNTLGANEKGEICVKSPNVMLKYLGDPKATAATIDSKGWLKTGDLGYFDEDGYFYLIDRLKEIIKYKGFQVAPAELESVVLSHPEIADVGVFGLPDVEAGELPMAYVVKKPNALLTEEQVKQFVSDRVAHFKRLRGGVRFVDSIPKSASGKILRNMMRNDLLKAKL